VIASKCPNLKSREPIVVPFSLRDLFRRYNAKEIEDKLVGLSFTSASKETELFADFIKATCGADLEANYETTPALDYYHSRIESRLRWLYSGDEFGKIPPCIDGFTKRTDGQLIVFDITVRPAVLVEVLAKSIESYLEMKAKIVRTVCQETTVAGTVNDAAIAQDHAVTNLRSRVQPTIPKLRASEPTLERHFGDSLLSAT